MPRDWIRMETMWLMHAYGDANHRLPRSQECRIVMMNCGALSLVSKKQTKTAPSSTCSETTGLFNTTTDVLGVRNLMTELGMHQEYPTVIYQDCKQPWVSWKSITGYGSRSFCYSK